MWDFAARRDQVGWSGLVLSAALVLIGLVLALGGTWLLVLGGSWYYALAGATLLAAGVYCYLGRPLGAWLYVGLYVVTVVWAFWESGLNGWALVPRLVAPTVLLIAVLCLLPRFIAENGARYRLRGLLALAGFVVVLGVTVSIADRQHVDQRVADPQPTPAFDHYAGGTLVGNWPIYGGGQSEQRYSELELVTPANVKNLKRAWVYRTGELAEEKPDKFGAETTPIKIGDTVYGCSGMNKLYALDAATGQQRWSYDPHVDSKYIPYTAACRGVAYYVVPGQASTTPCADRIFEGTLDGRVLAVDAHTGVTCQGFGAAGSVDITTFMGKVIPGMVSINSVPVIVDNIIVTGHQVQDGQYRWAPSGVIQGFDAISGKLRFAWDMMRPDIATEPPAGQTYTPGTPNMWTSPTGDPELGLVYLPMGNSGADYYSSTRRPEEKKYSSALVALDVHTGKPRWVFQTVHDDVWDYDLGSQVSLVDFPTQAGLVPALVLPSKTGEIYILDRRTGQSLQPVGSYTAPSGGVEPSERAPIQPISTFATLRQPALHEKDMWGMSPIDQMICRIQFRMAEYQGFFTPPTAGKRWVEYPGYNGGSDWGSVAVDPRRGVIVANYNDMPNYNLLLTRKEAEARGIFPLGDPRFKPSKGEDKGAQAGVPYADLVNPGWEMPVTKMLCKQPPYGGIRAIDLRTGKTLWDRPLGQARNNGPFGIPSMLPVTIGTPNNGGAVVTRSGLIFIAAATDNLIRAIDIRTGKTEWSDVLPAGGQATPMIYAQNGREYLVIMAGGHHFMRTAEGDYLVAYTLPKAP